MSPVPAGQRQSSTTSGRREGIGRRRQWGKRERETRKRKRKRHADQYRRNSKKKTNFNISRASLYPVSSLSLSRAPCLLEENELPVAQWKEYDKAFTCVSLSEEGFLRRVSSFALCFGHSATTLLHKEDKKKAQPPPLLSSLLCLNRRELATCLLVTRGWDFKCKEKRRQVERNEGK